MKIHGNKGFTLIEFVVIISIFAIMAGVALVNFAGFRSNVGLNNLSHDIALTIRQAQVFGWSGKTDSLGQNNENVVQLAGNDANGNPVRFADGVYFKYENNAFAKEFILYSKKNSTPGNEYYTEGDDLIMDTITIQGANHISAIHYADTKEALLLPPDRIIPEGLGSTGSFSVAFSRPRPEALFFSEQIPLPDLEGAFVGVYISADGDTTTAEHVITISRFGEIAVQ